MQILLSRCEKINTVILVIDYFFFFTLLVSIVFIDMRKSFPEVHKVPFICKINPETSRSKFLILHKIAT